MGTNVSLAVSAANKPAAPSQRAASSGSGGEGSGISVIRNGEAFMMANIAEVKLNLEDAARRSKPSCAVKPTVKPGKPSATVRPLVIQEALLKQEEEEQKMKEEEEERSQGEEMSAVAAPPSPTVYTVDEDDPQVVPVHLPSASEPLKMEVGEEKPAWQSFDQPAMSVGSSPSRCGVVPRSGEEVHGGAGEEETFNAEIVCPHGNLRIGERCKQLVTREVWHTVSSYFHNPKRFLFGK